MLNKLFAGIFFTVLVLTGCQRKTSSFPLDESIFDYGADKGLLENNSIREASGLVSSRANPNLFWTHNDHGDKNRLFLLDENGKDRGTYYIKNAVNRDWEDLATAKIDGVPYIYIADIGDNDAIYDVKYIYRFKEPVVSNSGPARKDSISGVEAIRISYPDGNHNAEALMVDQETNDFYIVTKFEPNVIVYRVPYPQSTEKVNVAEKVMTLPLTIITGADISPDNKEILIKNYENIYYWKRQPGEKIADALKRNPVMLPYKPEPHGEAVAFASDNSGYYTVSEVKHKIAAHLYFYKRK
jgi:hypothetical protein